MRTRQLLSAHCVCAIEYERIVVHTYLGYEKVSQCHMHVVHIQKQIWSNGMPLRTVLDDDDGDNYVGGKFCDY